MAFITNDYRVLCQDQLVLNPESPVFKVNGDLPEPNFPGLTTQIVKSLFVEGAVAADLLAPEPVGFEVPPDGQWPRPSYVHSAQTLEHMMMMPHLYVPRVFYSINPTMSLKLAIQWIYQLLYGIEKMGEVVARLHRTKIKMFTSFEMYYSLVVNIWSKDQVTQCPSALGSDFIQQVLGARIENLHRHSLPYMHFTQETRELIGLNVNNTKPLEASIARAVLQLHTRANPHTLIASYLAYQCSICALDHDSADLLSQHLTECVNRFGIVTTGSSESPMYKCEQCKTDNMPYYDMISHIYCFCTLNLRASCPYCNNVARRCQCAKNRLEQLRRQEVMLGGCAPYDLITEHNIFFLALWLDNSSSQSVRSGEVFDTDTIHNTDMLLVIQVSGTEIFIMNKTQHGVANMPIDTASEGLAALGVRVEALKDRLAIDCPDWLKKPPPIICPICWKDTTGEPNHLHMNHPKCFCMSNNFTSPELLIDHFSSHLIQGISCPDCVLKFETLGDMLSHFDTHIGRHMVNKPPCDLDLGMTECKGGEIDGYKFLKHLLMYHTVDKNMFAALIVEYRNIIFGTHDIYTAGGNQSDLAADTNPTGVAQQPALATQEHRSHVTHKSITEIVRAGAKKIYKCSNQRCLENNLAFLTKLELDQHVAMVHACSKPGCTYSNPDQKVLWQHIGDHLKKSDDQFICTICLKTFPDQLLLNAHVDMAHYLKCSVCGECYKTRTSLNIHLKSCNKASINSVFNSSPALAHGSVNLATHTSHTPHTSHTTHTTQDQPLMLIVEALANPSAVTHESLQRIKSTIIKESNQAKHIESFKYGADKSFVEIPQFSDENPLNIPNSRLKSLPRFAPHEGKPLSNYMSFCHLVTELNCVACEYRSTESQYLAMLLQQFSEPSKIQLKSILNITMSLASVPLEKVFECTRILYYDVELDKIYTQSTNLTLGPGESMLQFYARASSITRLGSYYLDDPAHIESFRSSNLRLQFLMASGKRFSDTIRTRELTHKVLYTPTELLRIYLDWAKTENSPQPHPAVTINKIKDVSLDAFVLGGKGNGSGKGRGNGSGKGKGDWSWKGRGNGKGNSNGGDNRNVNHVSSTDGNPRDRLRGQPPPRGGGNGRAPPRYTESTLQKRRALNIKGDDVICFLCGKPNHYPRDCKVYPGMKVQVEPCTSCRYYHVPKACHKKHN